MAVLSPPLKVMITGDYLKTAIAIARWGLSDLDPQGSIVFCISESLGISCIKSMSWSEIEMLQLGTPAFHNTRGVLCWKRGTSETLHRQNLAPSRPRASLRTSHTLVIHSSWGGSDHIPTIGSDHIPMTFRPIFGCCGCATLLQHSIWWISHRSKISPPLSVNLASDGCWRHPQDLSLPECASHL